jgi:hypothetical protein
MLILTMQIASSQTVFIDTISKNITLDRLKKIDVAKIILNEDFLFKKVNHQIKIISDYSILIEKLKEANDNNSDIIKSQEVVISLHEKNKKDFSLINKQLNKELEKEKIKKWKLFGVGILSVVIIKSL